MKKQNIFTHKFQIITVVQTECLNFDWSSAPVWCKTMINAYCLLYSLLFVDNDDDDVLSR
jgi:hypothetical protein